jgi:hypothetical protein
MRDRAKARVGGTCVVVVRRRACTAATPVDARSARVARANNAAAAAAARAETVADVSAHARRDDAHATLKPVQLLVHIFDIIFAARALRCPTRRAPACHPQPGVCRAAAAATALSACALGAKMAAVAAAPPHGTAPAAPDPWAARDDTWSELLLELQAARPLARVRTLFCSPAPRCKALARVAHLGTSAARRSGAPACPARPAPSSTRAVPPLRVPLARGAPLLTHAPRASLLPLRAALGRLPLVGAPLDGPRIPPCVPTRRTRARARARACLPRAALACTSKPAFPVC